LHILGPTSRHKHNYKTTFNRRPVPVGDEYSGVHGYENSRT